MIDILKARSLWERLHSFSDLDPQHQYTFFLWWFNDVDKLIGCPSCLSKLTFFLKWWPVDYGEGFHLWGLALHDFVNKELGRPLFCPKVTLDPLRKHGILQ